MFFLCSCGGGGDGESKAEPPASVQSVTVSVNSSDSRLGYSVRLTLPPGSPRSQASPRCQASGVCRGIVSASEVEEGSMVVHIASALPFAPGEGPCFTCTNISAPQGSTPSDYGCDCLQVIELSDLGPAALACSSPCTVTASQ